MAKRARTKLPKDSPPDVIDIWGARESEVPRFSSGCTVLDCVLGGGWGAGRTINLVGDSATGKTLLATESIPNFWELFPDGDVHFAESEGAFDMSYAHNLGIDVDRIVFPEVYTVEDVVEDLDKLLVKRSKPLLYIVDSLDALTDRKTQGMDIDETGWGRTTAKASAVSQWFAKQNQALVRANVTLMIVSQVRSNIGVTFGDKLKRSGGKALQFYASQVLWLAHLSQLKKTRKGVERVVGVEIRAKCKKNKLGPAHRTCDFPLMFGYGIEDVKAGLDFLVAVKRTDALGMSVEEAKTLASKLGKLDDTAYEEERSSVAKAVKEVWSGIELDFKPLRRKYGE